MEMTLDVSHQLVRDAAVSARCSMFSTRRLSKEDATEFQKLRLEGLKRHPDSFGASFSIEARQKLKFFADTLEKGVVFGGYDGTKLQGIVGFRRHQHEKMKHKGSLISMYVREESRGTELAVKLVQALLEHARQEVELVQLCVVSSNEQARRCYEKCGFEVYGVEPKALKVGESYFDELLMWVKLT